MSTLYREHLDYSCKAQDAEGRLKKENDELRDQVRTQPRAWHCHVAGLRHAVGRGLTLAGLYGWWVMWQRTSLQIKVQRLEELVALEEACEQVRPRRHTHVQQLLRLSSSLLQWPQCLSLVHVAFVGCSAPDGAARGGQGHGTPTHGLRGEPPEHLAPLLTPVPRLTWSLCCCQVNEARLARKYTILQEQLKVRLSHTAKRTPALIPPLQVVVLLGSFADGAPVCGVVLCRGRRQPVVVWSRTLPMPRAHASDASPGSRSGRLVPHTTTQAVHRAPEAECGVCFSKLEPDFAGSST